MCYREGDGDHPPARWDEYDEGEPRPGLSTVVSPQHRQEQQYSTLQFLFIQGCQKMYSHFKKCYLCITFLS